MLFASAALLAGHAGPAIAADAPPPADVADSADASDDSPIVVTGARSGTTEFKSSSPITVVNNASLTSTGQPDLRTALGEVNPSFMALQTSNGGSSSKPVRPAVLRGLSGYHTLVLVDGVRRHNTALLNNTSGSYGAPVDLSFIPIGAIDHIEVLSDGAAAQYGSDAIAGVVNIILKKGYNGGAAFAQVGEYDTSLANQGGASGRGFTTNFGGSLGLKIGREGGFFNVSGEYRHIDDSSIYGPVGTPIPGYGQSHIYAFNGVTVDPREYTGSRYRQPWEATPFGFAYDLLANAELPITPDVTLYANGTYGQNSLSSGGSYRGENNAATVVGSVPAVGTDGVTYTPQGTTPAGGYDPFLTVRQQDWQWTAGLKGEHLAGFKWDVSYSASRNRGDMYVNGINSSFYDAPGHGYRDIYIGRLQVGQQTVDINLTREFDVGWGHRPIALSFGGGYRRESFLQGPGEPDSYSQGPVIQFPTTYPSASLAGQSTYPGTPFMSGFNPVPLAGSIPAETGSWSRHSFAGYLDISQDVTRKLYLGAAGRVESYNDFGTRVAGKFSARYEFTEGFALRTTVNNGFRAPSLTESHTTVVSAQPGLANVGGQFVSVPVFSYNSLDVSSPYAAALGATPLKPETSLNFSAGFVARPVHNLEFSFDAYQINIHNRIGLTGSYTGNPSNGLPTPGATIGGLTVPSSGEVYNILNAAGLNPKVGVQYYANFGDTRTRGLEGKVSYRVDAGEVGQFAFLVSAAYNQQRVVKVNPNPVPALAKLGAGLLQIAGKTGIENTYPNWIVKGGVDWTRGVFNIHWLESYYSTTDSINASAAYATNPIYNTRQPGRAISDVVLSVTTPQKIRVSVGANNLFNVGNANQPITPPYHAQYLTYPLPVASLWGAGGRFIYARIGVSW